MIGRRTFFGGLSGAFVGLLFTRGVHKIVDRGLSHEEMTKLIIDTRNICIFDGGRVNYTLFPPDVDADRQCRSCTAVASHDIIRTLPPLDNPIEESIMSDPDLQVINIWNEGYYGRVGDRWILLG